MHKRVIFRSWWLPYLLVAAADRHHARLLHLAVLPGAGDLALHRGRVRAFAEFRLVREFHPALQRPDLSRTFWTTLVFGLSVTVLSMAHGAGAGRGRQPRDAHRHAYRTS
jgi:hypothetical protein